MSHDKEPNELVVALLARHNDTWPIQVGHKEPINPDGERAVEAINRLEYALKDIIAVGDIWSAKKAGRALRWTDDQIDDARIAARG